MTNTLNLQISQNLCKRLTLEIFKDLDKEIEDQFVYITDFISLGYNIKNGNLQQITEQTFKQFPQVFKSLTFNPELAIDQKKVLKIITEGNGPVQLTITPDLDAKGQETHSMPLKLIYSRFSKADQAFQYTTIFPIEFYKNNLTEELSKDFKKNWMLRAHHVETLTEHPFSLKDNLVEVRYINKDQTGDYSGNVNISKLKNFNSNEEKRLITNVQKKQKLIEDLEFYLQQTQQKIQQIAESRQLPSKTLPINEIQKVNYYTANLEYTKNKENFNETRGMSYEAILDQLRRQEMDILQNKRVNEEQLKTKSIPSYLLKTTGNNPKSSQNPLDNQNPATGPNPLNNLKTRGLY